MEQDGMTLIIRVDREIDHFVADRIRQEFEKKFMRGSVKNVIFDMSGVEFMDSSRHRHDNRQVYKGEMCWRQGVFVCRT